MNYQNEVVSYTKGKGRFQASLKGYFPTSQQDEIVASFDYHPENDLKNPSDSVFCANGSGFSVPWDKADEYMHIQPKEESSVSYQNVRYKVSNEDLSYIDSLTAGKNRNLEKMEAWDSLKEIAYEDIGLARDQLITYLYNYLPYLEHDIWVVFDGYQVKGNIGTTLHKKGLTIIYTKADQTADAYLEKSAYDLKNRYRVTYATSDALIQNAVFSQGALRMSAKELESRLILKNVILK